MLKIILKHTHNHVYFDYCWDNPQSNDHSSGRDPSGWGWSGMGFSYVFIPLCNMHAHTFTFINKNFNGIHFKIL